MGGLIFTFVAGVVFGVANVIPGVSGGTMAVVFGVYERLIGFLSDMRGRLRADWRFILTLGAGAAVGILALSGVMDWALTNHPGVANAFFLGVVIGSFPMLAKKAFRKASGGFGLSVGTIVPALVALAVMAAMAFTRQTETQSVLTNPVLDGLVLFLYGVAAAACMIIPGISGSFVLVLLGGYGRIVAAVSGVAGVLTGGALPAGVWILAPFALGAFVGIIYCAKLVRLLLDRFERQTYAAIFGFVLGSCFTLASALPGDILWLELLFGALGAAAILLSERKK